jgi:hypothetical protein
VQQVQVHRVILSLGCDVLLHSARLAFPKVLHGRG